MRFPGHFEGIRFDVMHTEIIGSRRAWLKVRVSCASTKRILII